MQLTLEPLVMPDPSILATCSNLSCFVSAFKNHNVQFLWFVHCSVFLVGLTCTYIRRVQELLTMRFSWRLFSSNNNAGFFLGDYVTL